MTWSESLAFSWRALTGHRLRSLLSLLGMSIGVAAVVVLTALGEGARRYVIQEFASLGTNLLGVMPGHTETTGAVPGISGAPNDLTLQDAEALERSLPALAEVAPLTMNTETVSFGERRRQVAILGSTPELLPIYRLRVAQGTFLPDEEVSRGGAVAVLGRNVAEELFQGLNPVGEVIRIGSSRMRVVGVLAQRGSLLGIDLDEITIVPVATGMRIFNRSSLFRILAQTHSYADIDITRQQVTDLLVERHGEEDITVITQDSVVTTFSGILRVLTFALAGIAAISLTVAGIGIMNVMLVSVSERTSEVGLLKALGAPRQRILTLFVIEAAILALAGGLLGLVLGWLAVRSIVGVYPALPASPPAWAVASALGVSLVVGVVFGLQPARTASRLDPVVALSSGQEP